MALAAAIRSERGRLQPGFPCLPVGVAGHGAPRVAVVRGAAHDPVRVGGLHGAGGGDPPRSVGAGRAEALEVLGALPRVARVHAGPAHVLLSSRVSRTMRAASSTVMDGRPAQSGATW